MNFAHINHTLYVYTYILWVCDKMYRFKVHKKKGCTDSKYEMIFFYVHKDDIFVEHCF